MCEKDIKHFREILIWPIQIYKDESPHSGKENSICLEGLNSHWIKVDDLLMRRHSSDASSDAHNHRQTHYAERVYFQPFVQRFLYGKESPMKLFYQNVLEKVRVTLKKRENPVVVVLDVIRTYLYIFEDTDTLILTMEVASQEPLCIQDAEDLLDQFRRAYPPYWEWEKKKDIKDKAGHCPLVEFLDGAGIVLAKSDYDKPENFLSPLSQKESGQQPVAAHWAWLLAPFSFVNDKLSPMTVPCRHLVDERIPVMAHIGLNESYINRLTTGDIIRLGLADEAGPSETLPCAAKFLRDFDEEYCYDRFWERNTDWKTKYIASDYSFVALGNGDDPEFFMNSETGILSHFRHHYFLMGIIIHFHRAALLGLADSIADAVGKYNSDSGQSDHEIFHKKAHDILDRLLRFTNRYWFDDISNQSQGKELFHFWRKKVGTSILYEQVNREVRDLNEYLEINYEKKQSKRMTFLTWAATIGMVVSLHLEWGQLMSPPPTGYWENVDQIFTYCLPTTKYFFPLMLIIFLLYLGVKFTEKICLSITTFLRNLKTKRR